MRFWRRTGSPVRAWGICPEMPTQCGACARREAPHRWRKLTAKGHWLLQRCTLLTFRPMRSSSTEKPGRYPRKRPGFSVACLDYLQFGDAASCDVRFDSQRRRLVLGFEADNAAHQIRRERDGELITRWKYFCMRLTRDACVRLRLTRRCSQLRRNAG